MRPLPRKISLSLTVLGAAVLLAASPTRARAQVYPAEISASQSLEVPYRDSGRLRVKQGRYSYLGSATYIRRYTGLTAGHLLYNGQTGLSTEIRYEPALYGTGSEQVLVGTFAVLSGYQAAARVNETSDDAFAQDMGYLLFSFPAVNNKWALWSAEPGTLTQGSSFDIIGYAAESFDGDKLAQARVTVPYTLLRAPGLYENTGYYSERGMSGGPVYVTYNGDTRLAAVTVGGSSPPKSASSGVRAITQTEQRLFVEAEYAQGLVRKGFIKGPKTASPGDTILLKAGIIFTDNTKEKANYSTPYDEIVLTVDSSSTHRVQINKVGRNKYQVFFTSMPPGLLVTFELRRTTDAKNNQKPLATYAVMVR